MLFKCYHERTQFLIKLFANFVYFYFYFDYLFALVVRQMEMSEHSYLSLNGIHSASVCVCAWCVVRGILCEGVKERERDGKIEPASVIDDNMHLRAAVQFHWLCSINVQMLFWICRTLYTENMWKYICRMTNSLLSIFDCIICFIRFGEWAIRNFMTDFSAN